MSAISGGGSQSMTVRRSAYALLAAHQTPPNKCDVILYSTTQSSSLSYQRNLNAFRSGSGMRTCRYIDSISAIKAYLYWRNRSNTFTRLFVKLGPCKHSLFRLTPRNLAEQSKTGLTFPGFLRTGWWGMYQTVPSFNVISFCGTRSAYPLLIIF